MLTNCLNFSPFCILCGYASLVSLCIYNAITCVCRGYASDRSIELKGEAKASGQGSKSGEFSQTTTKKVTKSGGSVTDHSKVGSFIFKMYDQT